MRDAARTRGDEANGVALLVVLRIRRINTVVQLDKSGTPIERHNIDVLHRPSVENTAHAQVEAAPHISNDKVFRKLRAALALLAEWHIKPASFADLLA